MAIITSPLTYVVYLILIFNAAFAFPASDYGMNTTSLVKRVRGDSPQNAIPADFNIANWQDIAEQDCYVMLCHFDGNRIYQRGRDGGVNSNRRLSGALNQPFENKLPRINGITTSAEEFPWASLAQGGTHAILQPAALSQQRCQGGAVGGGFRKANVHFGDWLEISFVGAEFRTYCAALHQTPPDFSVCKKTVRQTMFDTLNIDLSNTVYMGVKLLKPVVWTYILQQFYPKRPRQKEEAEKAPLLLVV